MMMKTLKDGDITLGSKFKIIFLFICCLLKNLYAHYALVLNVNYIEIEAAMEEKEERGNGKKPIEV